MGLVKDAFKWVIGLSEKSIDDINVQELEDKLRGVKRLQAQWEREIKQGQTEYTELLNPAKNVNHSRMELRFVLQRAKISAQRIRELTNAVTVLYRMSSLIENVKMLKKFYHDLQTSGTIPGGLTMEEFIKAVDIAGGQLRGQIDKLDDLKASFDDINRTLAGAVPEAAAADDAEIMGRLEKLQTLQAEGKGQTEEALKLQEEITKLYGLPV